MTMPGADEFLMGGGIPSAKFDTIGDTVTGTICQDPEVLQQRDFDTDELLFWDDGRPKLQLKVVLQTTDRDPAIEDDDGKRAIYIKNQMQKTVQEAVKKSGAKGLKVGGGLAVRFMSEEPNKRGRGNPKKIYSAAYQPPDPLAQVAEQQSQPAAPQQAAQQQALPTPVPAPALPTPTPAAAPAGPPTGIDPAVWATLSSEQQKAVAAAAGAPTF